MERPWNWKCNFNALHLVYMRIMLQRDRNLLAETRQELVEKIDDILHDHALTGCPCIEKAMKQEVGKR